MHATDGTIINWRMMESVVSNVDIIDTLVDEHGAGPYQVGKCESLIHTLSWTNCRKKELVSMSDLLCCSCNFPINKCSHCACGPRTETPAMPCP